MKTLGLGLFYTRALDVKRSVAVSGVIGEPTTILEGLRASLPMPVDPSGLTGLRESEVVQTLTEVFWVFVEGHPAIEEGDVVVVDSKDYVVRATQEHYTGAILAAMGYTRLTLEYLTI